jgi:hypothetical protein
MGEGPNVLDGVIPTVSLRHCGHATGGGAGRPRLISGPVPGGQGQLRT